MNDKKKIGYQDEERSPGLRLLKKGQKGLVRAVFSRLGLIVLLLLFQFVFAGNVDAHADQQSGSVRLDQRILDRLESE